jgi:hypothetical protein
MIRHFGVFQFKGDVTEADIQNCFDAIDSMVGKIPGLLSIEHGTYQSDEGLSDGFTHGFIMTFESFEARDAYLPHPIHESVKEIVVPKLERVIVFDFETKAAQLVS